LSSIIKRRNLKFMILQKVKAPFYSLEFPLQFFFSREREHSGEFCYESSLSPTCKQNLIRLLLNPGFCQFEIDANTLFLKMSNFFWLSHYTLILALIPTKSNF
jgi:hypothetical protein